MHRKGETAYERHQQLMARLQYYNGPAAAPAPRGLAVTDQQLLKEHHRFLRTEDDDKDDSYETQLARKYYDRLFKEYAVVDLTMAAEGKIGVRWRTKQEVVDGVGQFSCANKKACQEQAGLASYEINFEYREAGELKAALVKIRVCERCASLLNSRKQHRRAARQARKAHESKSRRRRRPDRRADDDDGDVGSASSDDDPRPTADHGDQEERASDAQHRHRRRKAAPETADTANDRSLAASEAANAFLEKLSKDGDPPPPAPAPRLTNADVEALLALD